MPFPSWNPTQVREKDFKDAYFDNDKESMRRENSTKNLDIQKEGDGFDWFSMSKKVES